MGISKYYIDSSSSFFLATEDFFLVPFFLPFFAVLAFGDFLLTVSAAVGFD